MIHLIPWMPQHCRPVNHRQVACNRGLTPDDTSIVKRTLRVEEKLLFQDLTPQGQPPKSLFQKVWERLFCSMSRGSFLSSWRASSCFLSYMRVCSNIFRAFL